MNSFALSKARDDIVRSDSFVESLKGASFAGYLDKLSTKGQWQRRFFTVHSHFLSYYKDRESYEENKPLIPAGSINLWHVSEVKLDGKKITLVLSDKPLMQSENQGVFPSPTAVKYVSSSASNPSSEKNKFVSYLFTKNKNERIKYVLSASTEEEAGRLIQAIQDCPALTHLARDLASLKDNDQLNQTTSLSENVTSSSNQGQEPATAATEVTSPLSSSNTNATDASDTPYGESLQSNISSSLSPSHTVEIITILDIKGNMIHQFTNLSQLHLEDMKSIQLYLPESIDDPSKFQLAVSIVPTIGEKVLVASNSQPISHLPGKSLSGDEIELLAGNVPISIKWELVEENSDPLPSSSSASNDSLMSSDPKELAGVAVAVGAMMIIFGPFNIFAIISSISIVVMFLLSKHHDIPVTPQKKSIDRYRITEVNIGSVIEQQTRAESIARPRVESVGKPRAGSIAQENIIQNLAAPEPVDVPDLSITKEEYELIAKLRARVTDIYTSRSKGKSLEDIIDGWFGSDPIADEYKQEKEGLRKMVCDRHIDTDYRIVRFLRARKNNLDKAETMLRISIEWRIAVRADLTLGMYTPPEYLIEYCGCPDIYNLMFKEKDPDYINNFFLRDRDGHLMTVARMGRLNWRKLFKAVNHDGNNLLKLGVWLLEFGRSHLDKLHEETNGKIPSYITLLVDLTGFAVSEQLPINTAIPLAKKFFFALSNSYPELLERIIIVNAPYLFASVWRLFQPFIPQEVQEKIIIHSDVNLKRDVIPYIPEEQIPAYLGGKYVGKDGDIYCLSRIPPYGPMTEDHGDSILARARLN